MKVHGYSREGWNRYQAVGGTACGLITGRVLGVDKGVKATYDEHRITCKRCRASLGLSREITP